MFKNIDQFKAAYGGVQRTMDFDTWLPFINEAKEIYFVDVLGYELINRLEGFINANDSTISVSATDQEKNLLGILRMSLSGYADYVGSFRLMQTIGDAGKTVASPPNMQAPGKWLSVASRADAISRGDKHLERALKYMEQNIASFTTWKNSSAFTIKNDLLINSADMFTRYFPNCRNSRRMYLAMVPYLRQAQHDLKANLTTDLYFEVLAAALAQSKNESVSDEMVELLDLARKTMAPAAVVKALPYVNINEEWRLVSETDGITNENVLGRDEKNMIVGRETANYQYAKTSLLEYLFKNASVTVFESFYASTQYAAMLETNGPKKHFENKKENKYAVL